MASGPGNRARVWFRWWSVVLGITLSLRIADQVALQMEQTAQIIGGYFAWRNLRVANESQITDRFTRAIDQLGSERSDKDGKPVPNLEGLDVCARADCA